MKPTRIQTLKNLDSVLGIQEIKRTPLPIIKPLKKTEIQETGTKINNTLKINNNLKINNTLKLDYFKFAELVNGRSSVAGLIAAQIVYTQTGHDLLIQITADPVGTCINVLGLTGVISIISLATFSKRQENKFLESFEDFTCKWNMANWLIHFSLYIVLSLME